MCATSKTIRASRSSAPRRRPSPPSSPPNPTSGRRSCAPTTSAPTRLFLDEVLARQRRERALERTAGLVERRGDQFHLAPAAVLRQLPAGLHARDGNREIDDAVQHLVDVFLAERVVLRQPFRVEAFDQAPLRFGLGFPVGNYF